MKYITIVTLVLIVLAFGAGNYLGTAEVDCGAECRAAGLSIPPDEFSEAINAGDATLIDVRTSEEYAAGHIEGATNTDFYQTAAFSDYLDGLDKDASYLVYCRSGNRSGQAMQLMQDKGFTKVTDLSGGIGAWQQAGLKVVQN